MKKLALIIGGLILSTSSFSAEKTVLRIGVQTSGTLDWELEVLPPSPDFEIKVQPVATAEAAKIALQSGAVDMIVSDWLFVSQSRNNGADFTFYPYSNTAGALVVAKNSTIQNIKDLAGKKLGIAGGELDKNWLLLQAVGRQNQTDLNANVEKIFGAPPLVNEQLKNGRVDAILTHWHFATQLAAQGYKQLLSGHDLQAQLGIQDSVPTLGYVFKESWANSNKSALKAFFVATKEAKNTLCENETAWQKATVKIDSASVLRKPYCDGRISEWTTKNEQAAGQLYSALFKLNPKVGKAENLAAGTFWQAE